MPWQLLYLSDEQRTWYEQAALRYAQRQHEIRQNFLNALVESFNGDGSG
jgi:hypothetical protein